MPTKGSELHTHVHPGNSDATDFIFLVLYSSQQGVRRFMDVVQIEQIVFIIEVRVQPIMNFAGREATSEL